MIHAFFAQRVKQRFTLQIRFTALCAVMVGSLLSNEMIAAQELIGPGTQTRMADELPAPSLADGSDPLSNDRLDEYRRALEDHLLKKERAKLEARARFESRSLDLVPAPIPPRRLSPQSGSSQSGSNQASENQAEANDWSGSTNNDDRLPNRRTMEDELPSPSDQPRDRNLDDLLAPPVPTEPNTARDLPPPLRSKPSANPQRLGQNSDEDEPFQSNPFPRSRSEAAQDKAQDKAQDRVRSIPKFEVVPESERQMKSAAPTQTKRDPIASAELKPARPNSGASAGNPTHSERSSHSVLQPASPYEDMQWSQLVDAERYRWATPASFHGAMPISDVHCSTCGGCVDRKGQGCVDRVGVMVGVGTRERARCQCWRCPQQAPFNTYGVGGYVGPARNAPVAEYRLRAGDQIQLTFLIKTVRTAGAYRLVVGDQLLVESDADENLTRGSLERGLEIQPDGTITLRFIGQVHAAGQTIEQLRAVLNERYEEFYPDPSIDVTPVQTNNVARQIREAISGSEGFNPQQAVQTVTPEGSIRLPRLGAVPTQGLTMGELKREINLRYDSLGAGLEVEVVLEQQAPHFIYVLGEVNQPGQFEIVAPTTVLGGLSLAGSYIPGANLRQVVVFRRGANWELISTVLDLRAAILGKASRPADEIWLQDGDVIIVPPTPIQVFDRFVQQVFTDGIYGVAPFLGNIDILNQNNN